MTKQWKHQQHEINRQYNKQCKDYDDDVSIENESPEDTYVTINEINTVHKMKPGQLNVIPETGDEDMENINTPTHMYNLRPRPTKRNDTTWCKWDNNQLLPSHIYVMLNQMGINEGIKKFRAKRNHILLKELNQLHERSMLLPKKKEEMSYDKRKKALRYLMFLK